jgi:hypothetical protein
MIYVKSSTKKRKFLQYIGQSETKMTCGDHAISLDKNYRELPVAVNLEHMIYVKSSTKIYTFHPDLTKTWPPWAIFVAV